MQSIQSGYRGLSLLLDLNWDLALYLGAITMALMAGAYLGSL
ncbi:MAG: hypothetical protein WBC93_07870 [Sulfitobacter sp.]